MNRRRRLPVPAAYLAQAVSVGGSAALTFLSTFVFSVDDRGRFAVFIMCATLGSYLLSAGVQSELLKIASRDGGARARAVAKHMWLRVAPLSVLISVLITLANPFPSINQLVLGAGMMAALVGAAFNWYAWIDFGQGKFARSTTLRGVIPATSLVVLLGADFAGSGRLLEWSIVGYISASCAGLLLLLVVLPKSDGLSDSPVGVMRSSLAYLGGQAATIIWVRFPLLVAAFRADPAVAAVVGLGLSVADLQAHLPQMRAAIVFREAAQSSSPSWTRDQLAKSLMVLLPGTILAVSTGFVLQFLLDQDYRDLGEMVLLLVPGSAALALLASVVNILAAQGRNHVATGVIGTGLVVLVGVTLGIGDRGVLGVLVWSAGAMMLLLGVAVLARQSRSVRS